MNQICSEDGCYMFGPDTPERRRCEQRCRLEHKAPQPQPRGLIAWLLSLGTLKHRPPTGAAAVRLSGLQEDSDEAE